MMLIVIFFLVTAVEVWATIEVLDTYMGVTCSFEFSLVIAAMALITNGVIFWFFRELRRQSVKNSKQ